MVPTTGFPSGLGKACAHLRWLGQLGANILVLNGQRAMKCPRDSVTEGGQSPVTATVSHTMLSRSVTKLPLKTTWKTSGPQIERALGCCLFGLHSVLTF